MQEKLSLEVRSEILRKEVERYVKRGYQVVTQTSTTAQLLRPKKFSFLWAVLWFLCFGIGLVVYLLWYAAKRDDIVYVSIDEHGKVKRR